MIFLDGGMRVGRDYQAVIPYFNPGCTIKLYLQYIDVHV